MQRISLTQGKFALINNEDYILLSNYNWCVIKGDRTFYAYCKINNKTILMHRLIMKAKKGQQVDHINHNGLDNRKYYNLRFADNSQQSQNSRKKRDCSSKYKGIYWDKKRKRWHLRIYVDNKYIHLGYFKNEIEAAKIYDQAALKQFGEYACLNFPQLNLFSF